MVKLLGGALILTGSFLLRALLLRERRRERQALREMIDALVSLEQGIRASLCPLPQLLRRQGAGEYADDFFACILRAQTAAPDRPFSACWRQAAKKLPLAEREREMLARLADSFSGEEEDVLRALRAAAEELRETLRVRTQTERQEGRLVGVYTLSFGVLLTIFLL